MYYYSHEVTIIGGGPAGSIAAIKLTDLGFDVCLVEKKIFPRETLCGEFLSKEVIENLNELNLYEEFISLNPNPIKNFKLINNDGREISVNLNFPAFGLRRSVFDDFLLTAVKRKRIKILQPAEVKEIRREDNCFVLTIKYKDGGCITVASKYVIAAYGKQNNLDKSLKRNFVFYKSNLNGVKLHLNANLFKEFKKDDIKIYLSDGIYCGVNLVENNYITICFLENTRKQRNSSRQNLLNFISGTEKFKSLFNPGYEEYIKSNMVYGTGNIFFGKRKAVENGIFMIGDAAGVIAPITGDGIAMAFQSAGIISQLLFKVRSDKLSIANIEKYYQIEWDSLFRNRIFSSYIIQNILLLNFSRNVSLEILNRFPKILPYFIKITRG
jgi:flavin-dependent dehydrogenase